MRVVLATEGLVAVGGTETYVVTVAEHLLRLGHEVGVYAAHLGEMAELARERGVDVCSDLDELGDAPEVVFAQASGVAYELADRWPQVPQVFVCHSELFDVQQPPLVPGVAPIVVVMNDRTRQRVEASAGASRVVRLRQPVDTERLAPRRPPSILPRRALLLGNTLVGEPLRVLRDTWGELGLEVVQVGTPTSTSLSPEADIAAADIVVGKGRAILDAMSCGRPAYVYDSWGGDGWVTAETFEAIEANGLGGQAFADIIDAPRLRADLTAYDPDMGRVNRLLATSRNGARAHVHALVELARDVTLAPPAPVTEAGELARMVRLRWRAESELVGLRQQFQLMTTAATQDLAEARTRNVTLSERLSGVESDVARLDAALAAELVARASAERSRDRARARGRRLKTRLDALQTTPWVRLGRALRLLDPTTTPLQRSERR